MTKLFHIYLNVTDVARSVDFYTKCFEGAFVQYEALIDGFGYTDFPLTFVDLGNGVVLELGQFPEENGDGKWQHIAFTCDDIQAQYDRMIAAGAKVKQELKWDTYLKGRNGFPSIECYGAHLWGPDGEVIELCQDKE